MRKPKIVSTVTIPYGENMVFMELDENGKIYYTEYREGCHMDGKEIAKHTGYTDANVVVIIRRALRKIFKLCKKENKDLNPLELTALIGEMLNVKTEIQYMRFIKSLPNDIKKELKNYALMKAKKEIDYNPTYLLERGKVLCN